MSVEGVRFAHTEGRVSLVYSRNGKKVHTLGLDGEMRVWAGIDDDDCENIAVGEEGFAVAVAKDRMFVATSETNSVQVLNMEGDNEGVVTKFTADVICLDTLESGSLLASGSADMTVKVTDTEKYTDKVLTGHQGPILSVALDPLKQFVGSSSCDGTVRVWEISTKKQVKSHDFVPKSNDATNSSTVCGLRFSSSGAYLAVPRHNTVVTLLRNTWEVSSTFTTDRLGEKEIFTCVDWNTEETMIIAGTSKGNLCVWGLDGPFKYFLNTERKYPVSAVAWNPVNSEEASFADSQGYWGLVSGLRLDSRTAGGTADQLSQEELSEMFKDDEEDENSFSISKVQAEAGFAKDEDGHLVHGMKAGGVPSSRPESSASSYSAVVSRPAPVEPVRLQPPFQPSSSPDHFTFRFLVYNSVGIVKTIQENNIDVDFHDSSTHYNLFFRNPENYSMAALTDKVLVLAREGDEETAGKMTVHNFKCSENNNEWSVDLSEGEYVLGVAAGEGWVAVATSKNYLRLFTAWGIQREIVSLAGPLVSMVGSGGILFVVTHTAQPLHKQQNLGYYNININFRRGLSEVSGPACLPLTPSCDLYWVGISDTSLPVTTDTAGVVRMLINSAWFPICDTRANMLGKADTLFVTCVDQKDCQVRGIKCRGSRYPQTIPRPSPTSLTLEVPFCITGERGGLEQRLIFSTFLAPVIGGSDEELEEKTKREELECLMKIFALACRADQEARALEVCKLMSDVDSIQMAIQYAAKIKRVGLASKLGELAMSLQDAEQQKNDEEEEEETGRPGGNTESQDMFADSQDPMDNPLLAARTRTIPSRNTISSKQEPRNPFAKKSLESRASLENSPGIVFDTKTNFKPMLTKKILLLPINKNKVTKPIVVSREKENKVEGGELKGFQLFMVENQEEFPGTPEESQQSALASWKSLDKSAKDKYKSPRVPNQKGKRKLSDDTSAAVTTAEKKAKSSFTSKLSGFAFGAN